MFPQATLDIFVEQNLLLLYRQLHYILDSIF